METLSGEKAIEILYEGVTTAPFIKSISLSNLYGIVNINGLDVKNQILHTSKPLCYVKRYELYENNMLKNKDKINFSGTVYKDNPIKLVDENDSNNARIEVYS